MSLSGMAVLSSCANSPTSRPTEISSTAILRPRAEREDRRLIRSERRDIQPPRGSDDRVRDPRLADKNLGRVLRQIDDHRPAETELKTLHAPRFDGERGWRLRVAGDDRGRDCDRQAA